MIPAFDELANPAYMHKHCISSKLLTFTPNDLRLPYNQATCGYLFHVVSVVPILQKLTQLVAERREEEEEEEEDSEKGSRGEE